MQKFDQIEALWASHSIDLKISADDMLKQAKREMNAIRSKSVINIMGMLASLLIVASLWIYQFDSWTTHAGIAIIILSIATYTFILYRNYRTISSIDITQHPEKFLSKLKVYQLQRHNLYTKLYWFYAIALSLGMGLYLYALIDHLKPIAQLIFCTLSFGWIVFCSTLVRKAVIQKDKQRISLLIEKFERISDQFKNNEQE
ncbi:MAG: hypothetical protein EOO99_02865 [Pedobacter sp.]|nr:MAG: hypothetical protein EOO99_02865 [Pedobacter sp.]